MDFREIDIKVSAGGDSSQVAISGANAQSAAFAFTDPNGRAVGSGDVVVTATVDCFFRQGANPTALANGTDQFLLAGNTVRLSGILTGNKLAFITSGATGTVYLTPGA